VRILFVGFPDSIHVVRWINSIAGQGWDIHLFPSTNSPLHKDFRDITTYGFGRFRPRELHPTIQWKQLWPHRGLSRLSGTKFGSKTGLTDRSRWLARVVKRLKPDIVHSLELQHSSYLTVAARSHLPAELFPRWVVSNWGSDIYLFGSLAEHHEKIREVLSVCDEYICECERDIELAFEYGFQGQAWPVLPNTGGFDLQRVQALRAAGPPSARRTIALKGYQNWAGRALFGLRALEMCADALSGYSVSIYSADDDLLLAAELFSRRTGLPVQVLPRGSSHDEIMEMHGRARISIGLSISDAASTSALEAMVMGSFPVQSNTSCLGEWARNGETALLVHPEDPDEIAAAVRRALSDDEMIDRAAEENSRIAAQRLDHVAIRPLIIDSYQRLLERQPASPRPTR
jgi:hypothetical protein